MEKATINYARNGGENSCFSICEAYREKEQMKHFGESVKTFSKFNFLLSFLLNRRQNGFHFPFLYVIYFLFRSKRTSYSLIFLLKKIFILILQLVHCSGQRDDLCLNTTEFKTKELKHLGQKTKFLTRFFFPTKRD